MRGCWPAAGVENGPVPHSSTMTAVQTECAAHQDPPPATRSPLVRSLRRRPRYAVFWFPYSTRWRTLSAATSASGPPRRSGYPSGEEKSENTPLGPAASLTPPPVVALISSSPPPPRRLLRDAIAHAPPTYGYSCCSLPPIRLIAERHLSTEQLLDMVRVRARTHCPADC